MTKIICGLIMAISLLGIGASEAWAWGRECGSRYYGSPRVYYQGPYYPVYRCGPQNPYNGGFSFYYNSRSSCRRGGGFWIRVESR